MITKSAQYDDVSFVEGLTIPLKKIITFNGRASRKEFWLFALWEFLIYLLLGGGAALITGVLQKHESALAITSILILIFLCLLQVSLWITSLSLLCRRLHDTNRSELYILLGLIPIIGWVVIFVFTVLSGDPQFNDYGPHPSVDYHKIRMQKRINEGVEAPVVAADQYSKPVKKVSGCMLVFLIASILLVPLLGIFGAIAIPNLMESRIRANEANAIASLKELAAGCVQFSIMRNNMNGPYCPNFRNLYYFHPEDSSETINLISKTLADAFIVDDPFGQMPTVTTSTTNGKQVVPPMEGVPYQGYLFAEIPLDFSNNFGYIAIPATAGATGRSYYIVSAEGIVYLKAAQGTAEQTLQLFGTQEFWATGWDQL